MEIQTAPKLLMSRIIPDAELDTGVFGIKTPAIQRCWVVASDDVLYTDSSEVSQAGKTGVKKKEMTIPGGYESVIVRVKFNLKTSHASYAAFGQIYKNGVQFGTLWYTSSLTYEEFTEDLTFSPGDTVELWLYNAQTIPITTNDVFTVSGKEVLSSGIVGQAW